jgi:hypothetical protein
MTLASDPLYGAKRYFACAPIISDVQAMTPQPPVYSLFPIHLRRHQQGEQERKSQTPFAGPLQFLRASLVVRGIDDVSHFNKAHTHNNRRGDQRALHRAWRTASSDDSPT